MASRCLILGVTGLFAVLLSSTAHAGDGVLDAIREDVRTDKPDKQSPKRDRDDHHRHSHKSCGHTYACDCDDDSVIDEIASELFLAAVATPFWLPHTLLEDSFIQDKYFAEFPYDGTSGYMLSDVSPIENPRTWSARLRGELGDDFEDTTRIGGHLLVSNTSRFGVDTEWNYRREDLSGGGRDELWTGDLNLVYRFAQSEHAQFRAGLGANWLHDQTDTNFGFNFTYGADFFPAEPWVLSGTMDLGTIGHASLLHGRFTVGTMIENWELFGGYDYLSIGGVEVDGFIAGIRIWF